MCIQWVNEEIKWKRVNTEEPNFKPSHPFLKGEGKEREKGKGK